MPVITQEQFLKNLKNEFPLYDETGIDPWIHCCEYTMLLERKRLHQTINKYLKQYYGQEEEDETKSDI